MKKCPVCHKTFTRSMVLQNNLSKSVSKLTSEHLMDGKGVIRCPHCSARLRKKISIWFIPALIPFVISVWWYSINHQYPIFIAIAIAIFVIFYSNLPYVPYDKQ